MNPTSPLRQSPVHSLAPNSSPSLQREQSGSASSSDQMQWHIDGECTFPVFSENEIQKFRQKFNHSIKEIALHLQAMMACLSKNSPKTMTTPWKALSTLVSCLGNDLPNRIPLSIFTSAVATACLENITASSPAKKSKRSKSSEKPDPRNKILATTQKLVNTISETLNFLQTELHLNILKEKNPDSHQANRAFKNAVSQICSVEHSVILGNNRLDLAERIISAIAPQGDACSHESKDQLLRSAITELVNTQEILISDVYINLAQQKKPLPITGKNLLAVCTQHYTGVISASANIECLPSWENLSFCYLTRTFLQRNTTTVPHQADLQVLLDALTPYFPMPDTTSSLDKKQCLTRSLTTNFLSYHSKKSAKTQPRTIDLNFRYNEFLQCFSLMTNFLKGLFILETSMCFSFQNLSAFQAYAQALHLPNTTATINTGIQEVASICAEEHQTISSHINLCLKNTNKLLKELTFQSLALAITSKQKWKTITPQEMAPCTWMPDELRLSMLFYNYWEEAHFAHSSNVLFADILPTSSPELTLIIHNTSQQLKTTFHRLCYKLLMEVFKEKPLGGSENAVDRFCTAAHTLQSKTIPKHLPASQLFKIAINFIATSKNFIAHHTILDLAIRDFKETQTAFIEYTYSYLLQHESHLPATAESVLAYCKEHCQKNLNICLHLEKLPFLEQRIALCMIQGASKGQSQSDFCLEVGASAQLVQRDKPSEVLKTAKTVYDRTACENFLQSITSFKELLQALFQLDTGKQFSLENLRAFQAYLNELLSHVKNVSTTKMVLGTLAICLQETSLSEENPEDIQNDLTKIFIFTQKLLTQIVTLFVFRNTGYKHLSPQLAVTEAFRMIFPYADVSHKLLLSTESEMFWKKIIKDPPKKKPLLRIPNFFQNTSKIAKETASQLTKCSLSLCQKLLFKISSEIFLAPIIEQTLQKKEKQFMETAYFIYPKIFLEDEQKQFTFKELVAFLAKDKTHTGHVQILTLSIENVLTAQQELLESTYNYLIQHRLPLPLTGGDLLAFCKQKHGSLTHVPLSLTRLFSWNNVIFCTLARIFLLSIEQPIILAEFNSWNLKALIAKILSFFPETNKKLAFLPEEIKITMLSKRLARHFRCFEPLDTHGTIPQSETDPYACKAYEHFLQSAALLKGLFIMLFKLETENECSKQNVPTFYAYIKKLFINEPDNRRTSTLRDVAMICFEELQTSEQATLFQLWDDLNCANFLLQHFMECSLALTLLCANMNLELTAHKTVTFALQTTSCIKSFPTTLNSLLKTCIISTAGTNAFQGAMHAFSSGSLCSTLFEENLSSSQETKINILQTAIDAHMAGHSCPKIAECSEWLSSMILSEQEKLENFCQKLYTNLKENITASISKGPSAETPSQKFITTANNCYAAMIFENHTIAPLFEAFVFILAQEYANNQNQQETADTPMKPAEKLSIPKDAEVLSDNIWQPIEEVLLEDLLGADSQLTPTQRTEPDKSPTELCPEAEDILSADDFTDFLGQTELFGQDSKITTTQLTEEENPLATLWPNIEQILSSEDFTDLLESPESFVGLATQEDSQSEVKDTEKESAS